MKLKRIVFLIPLLLMACSVTPVHKLKKVSADKVAYIEGVPGYNPLSVIEIRVYSIDGVVVSRRNNVFEVEAGEHQIDVICRREQPEFLQRHFSFRFYLKAGHRYKPKPDMTRDCHLDYIEKPGGKIFQGSES